MLRLAEFSAYRPSALWGTWPSAVAFSLLLDSVMCEDPLRNSALPVILLRLSWSRLTYDEESSSTPRPFPLLETLEIVVPEGLLTLASTITGSVNGAPE